MIVWNTDPLSRVAELLPCRAIIRNRRLGEDFRWLVVETEDGAARAYNMSCDKWICAYASWFVDDERVLVVTPTAMVVFQWRSKLEMARYDYPAVIDREPIAISPDRRHVALPTDSRTAVLLLDARSARASQRNDFNEVVRALEFHPNSESLAAAVGQRLLSIPIGGGTPTECGEARDEIRALQWVTGGDAIFAVDDAWTMYTWDAKSWTLRFSRPLPTDLSLNKPPGWPTLAVSADGREVAVGSDSWVAIVDVETGECARRFTIWAGTNSLSLGAGLIGFLKDSRYVLTSGGVVDPLRLWDTQSGSCVYRFGSVPEGVAAIAFDPRRRWIATGGGHANSPALVRLWRIPDCAR